MENLVQEVLKSLSSYLIDFFRYILIYGELCWDFSQYSSNLFFFCHFRCPHTIFGKVSSCVETNDDFLLWEKEQSSVVPAICSASCFSKRQENASVLWSDICLFIFNRHCPYSCNYWLLKHFNTFVSPVIHSFIFFLM